MFPDNCSMFERLIANMQPQDGSLTTQCWVWTRGCCNKGYGHAYFYSPDAIRTGTRGGKGKSVEVRAHIASYVLANGPLGENMTLDHKCRNTKCIRPSHLEEVTRVENTRRGNAARRKAA